MNGTIQGCFGGANARIKYVTRRVASIGPQLVCLSSLNSHVCQVAPTTRADASTRSCLTWRWDDCHRFRWPPTCVYLACCLTVPSSGYETIGRRMFARWSPQLCSYRLAESALVCSLQTPVECHLQQQSSSQDRWIPSLSQGESFLPCSKMSLSQNHSGLSHRYSHTLRSLTMLVSGSVVWCAPVRKYSKFQYMYV